MRQTQSKQDAAMIDAAISAAQSQEVTVIVRYADGSLTYVAGEVGNPKALGKKMTTITAGTNPRSAYMQICRDLDLVA